MISDNGKEFRNKAVGELLSEHLGVQQRFTQPYSPQTNGLAERANGVIAATLAEILQGDVETWPRKIYHALYAMRHSIHTSTGFTPASLLLGRDTLSIVYVQAHGVPPIDEEGLAQQMEEEDENRKNTEGADKEYENHVQQEYEAAKQKGRPIGTVDRPDDIAPKRPRIHEELFQESELRGNENRATAAENHKKKTSQNAAHYNRRNRVGAMDIKPGDLILGKNQQYSAKTHGRFGERFSGPSG